MSSKKKNFAPEIHIWKNYYATIDPYQYIIYEKRTYGKDSKYAGEEYYTVIPNGFITNLKRLPEILIRLELLKDIPRNLNELLNKSTEMLIDLKKAFDIFKEGK